MSIPSQLTLDTFGDRILELGSGAAVPVLRDEDVVGVISSSQLRRLRRQAWPTTRAEQLMLGGAALTLLRPDDGLWSAIQRIRRAGADGLPVVDASGLLGVLTVRSIVATIQARAKRQGVSVP
jgi:CBS domain-containing protein